PHTTIYTLSLHDALPISKLTGIRKRSKISHIKCVDPIACGLFRTMEMQCVKDDSAYPPSIGAQTKNGFVVIRGGFDDLKMTEYRDRKSTRLNSSHVSISY